MKSAAVAAKNARLTLLLLCVVILVLSCSRQLESEIDEQIRADFKINYRIALEKLQLGEQYLLTLESYEKSNIDTFRTVAHTWQNSALEECAATTVSQVKNNPLSPYEALLNDNRENTFSTQGNDPVMQQCVSEFYVHHWKNINDMLNFSFSRH